MPAARAARWRLPNREGMMPKGVCLGHVESGSTTSHCRGEGDQAKQKQQKGRRIMAAAQLECAAAACGDSGWFVGTSGAACSARGAASAVRACSMPAAWKAGCAGSSAAR